MVNVLGGVVSMAGGTGPGARSGDGGRAEEIPVPTTGGVQASGAIAKAGEPREMLGGYV